MLLLRLASAALGGLAIWLAFPSFDLWFLAPVGVAVLILALRGVRARLGFVLGLFAGWGYFVPLLSWSGIFVGWLPWLALATLSALYLAAFGAVAAYLQGPDPTSRVRPFAVSLAWLVAEYARSTTPFGGFPWGRIGFSQADSPVLGVVRYLGVPGLGFVVVLSGGLLAYGIHQIAGREVDRGWLGRSVATVGAGVLAVAVLLAPSLIERPINGDPAQITAIQGNVPEMTLEFNAQRRAVLDNHAGATRQAAELIAAGEIPAPDLVVWPENSSDIDPLRNPDAADVIQAAVAEIQTPVIVGAVLAPPGEELANTALLYLPGEGPVQSYVKQRPVPFAEYIPYRDFFRQFSDKVDLVSTDFVAGDGVGLLQVPLAPGAADSNSSGDDAQESPDTLPVGVAICFEVVIDDLMAQTVRSGAEVILVPTNNATFGFTDESEQQLAASRVKAVELGRSIVHISTVGVSGFVAPDASVTEQTELFTEAIISSDVVRRTETTMAVRLGPYLEPVAVGLLLLTLGTAFVRRRRAKDTEKP
ncbi:MAG: apolipoprotein N-acyltransferase [Ornithinimicrobium sp.]